MVAVTQHPALAQAADALSGQLRVHLSRLAGLLGPRAAAFDREFRKRLRDLGFDPRQQKALAGITPGAAARILSARLSLAEFLEQVEYNGRRLAKLGLAPARIVRALRQYDRLAKPLLAGLPARESANLRWALAQLRFCVLLTLNNAFYEVREAETRTYQELFRAELDSRGLEELLVRMLGVLARFCRAQAGALFLYDRDPRQWRRRAAWPDESPEDAAGPLGPIGQGQLSRARCVTGRASVRKLALDAGWPGRYSTCWSVPMAGKDGLTGVFQFAFATSYEWLPREQELLSAAAERCLEAVVKARLAEELVLRGQQVRSLAERMIEVEERERRRISSELHDEAGQMLLSIRLHLELLERTVPEAMGELKRGLQEARGLTEQTIVEIRRLIADLSPAVLAQLGLAAALRQLVSRFRRHHGARITLHLGPVGALPQRLRHVVYRLAQECLNNVARHSSASKVMVSLDSADGKLRLRVEDNGAGFELEHAQAKRDSFGLAGMLERAALFGGRLVVRSRPKRGTVVLVELPLE